MRVLFRSFLLCSVAVVLTTHSVFAQQTYPLWPDSVLASAPSQPERDTTTAKDDLVAGKRVARITGVTHPSMALYSAPASNNSGVAVVVFPGGGYRILAYDLEGTEVCTWLNAIGVNCILLKYRVPNAGPYPAHPEALADAQRALRLSRQHAGEWKLDPERIGVLGFSAGGHLAAAISNHFKDQVYAPIDDTDQLSAKPAFAFVIYPGYLAQRANRTQIESSIAPSSATPPTFLVQAEDDPVHVENTLVYYAALKNAKVPAEMHVYAHGGHGYGLRPTELPITHWPILAADWLHTIGMIKEPVQSR